jgi:hypothetical protein
MVKSRFNELDKIMFVGWVDKSLDQSLTNKIVKLVLEGEKFNPKIMENKTPPTKVYASRNSNGGQQGEYHYSSDDQTNHNHLKEEEFAIALLINITIIYS